MRQLPWSPFEVAYLIYQYWRIEYGTISRKDAVSDISRRLRDYAAKEGTYVDDTFRNENGISMRLEELRCLFTNGEKGIMNTSALFRTMVMMYQTSNNGFQAILKKAKEMFEPKTEPDVETRKKPVATQGQEEAKGLFERTEPIPDAAQKEVPVVLLDWNQYSILPSMIPVRCTYYDNAIPFNETWEGLYTAIAKAVYNDHPVQLSALVNVVPIVKGGLQFANQFGMSKMAKPKKLKNYVYLETDCTPLRMISNLRLLLTMCRVDFSKVKIYYKTEEKEAAIKPLPPESKPALEPPVQEQSVQLEPKPVQAEPDVHAVESKAAPASDNGIILILKKHFQYGFKPDSVRDLMRFRMFADEAAIELPENDDALKEAISSVSTVVEGKWFAQSDEVPDQLQKMVTDIFADGTVVIYYEALLKQQAEWMREHHISSESMLKEMLQKQFPEYAYAKRFMMNESQQPEYEAVSDEILRTWGDKATKSVADISVDLPYIPMNNIWRAISRSPLFERVSEGVYFLTDKLIISEDESDEIFDFVEHGCAENGFVSLGDLPLESVEEENYEIPLQTIQAAVYCKLLADRYTLNGRILTAGDAELSAVTLLKQYLAGKERCTMKEMEAKNLELIGRPSKRNAFQALYDCMVRIDENQFVSLDQVEFDIDEIDRVLAGFITDHFCAIQDITTFAMFPICGQEWNHYLLESYCYKFSRRFSLRVRCFNSRNIGIIAEKTFRMDFFDMLAIVVSKADIELTPDAIGPYLFKNGYLGTSRKEQLDEIAAKAKALRKDS